VTEHFARTDRLLRSQLLVSDIVKKLPRMILDISRRKTIPMGNKARPICTLQISVIVEMFVLNGKRSSVVLNSGDWGHKHYAFE